MLSSLAVLDALSLEFCIMVAEAAFGSSSIVGLNLSKKFLSSTGGSEVAVILLAGERMLQSNQRWEGYQG